MSGANYAYCEKCDRKAFYDADTDIQDCAVFHPECLAAHTREAARQALIDAADEMDGVIAAGDVAEVAAHVDGEVGRQEAVSDRDSLYEEPSSWLRVRAGEAS